MPGHISGSRRHPGNRDHQITERRNPTPQITLTGDIAQERIPPTLVSERQLRVARCTGCPSRKTGVIPIPSTWICQHTHISCLDIPDCPENRPLPGRLAVPAAYKNPLEKRCVSHPPCPYLARNGKQIVCTHRFYRRAAQSLGTDERLALCAAIPVCPIGRVSPSE